MTCKDCIHEELCMDKFKNQYPSYANKNITVDDCEHFKNKADFVEVVRCFWCDNAYKTMTRCYCNRFKADVCENSFCSYGERK